MRAFLVIAVLVVAALALFLVAQRGGVSEQIIRKALFNGVSILTIMSTPVTIAASETTTMT